LEGKRSRGTQRQFCDDRCRLIHWILKKAATLLPPLEQSRSWEILLKLSPRRVIPTRMAKKTPPKTFTVNEAAKKLGVTRAAIHQAIKDNKLEWTWGTAIQVIERRAKLIDADSLAKYRVNSEQQGRGKKTS
jgi:hypothetical protein